MFFVNGLSRRISVKFPFFVQEKKGYFTESETDTEVIVKLLKYVYDRDQESSNEKKLNFPELVEQVIHQLVCAFLNAHN